ncbi:hypothetical protein ACHAXA_003862 [Cyclostephanos tholiformis]|uniref:ATPase of the ABC class C-terminal domain-containing protein n=1 Tax=Cyclostephanos tholiformis TaxID=382380 RepID=A0ABD3RWS0_9STRA
MRAPPSMSSHIVNDILLRDDMLPGILDGLRDVSNTRECLTHAACVVLQRTIRSMLSSSSPHHPSRRSRRLSSPSPNSTAADDDDVVRRFDDHWGGKEGDDDEVVGENALRDAVAFVADGSILPRKSGRSCAPMSCPPCLPFVSPVGSESLTRVVTVDVGRFWRGYLNDDGTCRDLDEGYGDDDDVAMNDGAIPPPSTAAATTTVTMRGMIIPRGVTLIVGGGYHGKSTLLQALAYGVYDKIPRDGRERCVAHVDAVSVRAEDGRYVNNLNVSAFISNLPGGTTTTTTTTTTTSTTGNLAVGGGGSGDDGFVVDSRTRSFGTRDASGSTSQAANVIEALESGASTLLVDEDVSAANFMARDGRMRAMIMDEPITPLLYRVNGLYLSRDHGTSTIIVVGGVGEWLDVADAVVLMKDYAAYDGLAKARSVSYQFSYGHVQYAGRGVVHRLPWKSEARDGGGARRNIENVVDDDVDDGGLQSSTTTTTAVAAAASTLNLTLSPLRRRPGYHCFDISELLDRMERALDNWGMNGLLATLMRGDDAAAPAIATATVDDLLASHHVLDMWSTVGYTLRPRRHEVAMALTRMRGMSFDLLPEKPKTVMEEEDLEMSKKRALAELWANRRKR